MENIQLDNVQAGYLDSILFAQEQKLHEDLQALTKESEKLSHSAQWIPWSKKVDEGRIEEINIRVNGCYDELALLKELRSKLGEYHLATCS